ncbi:hypothetical protein LOZ66_000251 [Ophidiomyces ophidiicola]|nr:hypothetical protein LOZ66_000251 [Ophidiomyces ophidiicola]
MASSPNCHIACNRCRLRKVKCDGRRPWCKRCSGTGAELECSYETRRKSAKRQGKSPSPPITSSHISSVILAADAGAFGTYGPIETPSSEEQFNETIMSSLPTFTALGFGTPLGSCLEPMPSIISHTQIKDAENALVESSHPGELLNDDMFGTDTSMLKHTDLLFPSGVLLDTETAPLEHLPELYHRYFMTTHRTFALIDQDTFLSNTSETVNTHDILALSCAVCAHAAGDSLKFAPPDAGLSFLSDRENSGWYYRQAKHHLEFAENDCQSTVKSLAALQATVLVGLYELKHAQFSRAWLTTSRAVWLAQALQHGKLDTRFTPRRRMSLLTPPPTPISTDTNEERNTLWAVLTLNCFLSVGTSSNIMDSITQSEMGMYLPQEDGLDMACLRLDDVLRRSRPWKLSDRQGLGVVTILCTRTIQHAKMINHSDPLDRSHYFWTQHYHLDEAIRYVKQSTSADNDMPPDSEDIGSNMILRILLKATAICLHETLLSKAEAEVSSHSSAKRAMQIQSSEALTLQYSLDMVNLVQTSISKEEIRANVFFCWAIYVAIQSLVRHQHRNACTHPHLESTRRLSVSTSQSSGSSNASTDEVPFNCFRNSFCNGFHSIPNNSGCTHCGIPMDSSNASHSNFGTEDMFVDTLAEAMILDSISSLQSSLIDLSHKIPLAKFFCEEIEMELRETVSDLKERVVGLAAFTNTK